MKIPADIHQRVVELTDAILAGLNDEYIQSKGKGGKAAPATAEESETE